MHKIESRETSDRKYLSKTILACRERQAKKTKQTIKQDVQLVRSALAFHVMLMS